MIVVTRALAEGRPDVVKDLYRMLAESKAAAPATSAMDLRPIGEDAIRPSLELVVELAAAQSIIPRRFDVDELFAPWRAIASA